MVLIWISEVVFSQGLVKSCLLSGMVGIKMPGLISFCKNDSKSSKNNYTSIGEITSPCLNPTEYSKQSENVLHVYMI